MSSGNEPTEQALMARIAELEHQLEGSLGKGDESRIHAFWDRKLEAAQARADAAEKRAEETERALADLNDEALERMEARERALREALERIERRAAARPVHICEVDTFDLGVIAEQARAALSSARQAEDIQPTLDAIAKSGDHAPAQPDADLLTTNVGSSKLVGEPDAGEAKCTCRAAKVQTYLDLEAKLLRLGDDSADADALRDELDSIWFELTDDERERLNEQIDALAPKHRAKPKGGG